jgi:hypothetical protein
MSIFSKIGGSLGKAANFVVKNPVTSTVMGLIPGGNLAKSGINFVAAATAKGSSPSAPSLQTVSPVEQSTATRAFVQSNTEAVASKSSIKDMLLKAWNFIKSYWYFVLPTVLIIIFVVVKYLWPKKRPVSRRRTAGAARARAAKAAKRRR